MNLHTGQEFVRTALIIGVPAIFIVLYLLFVAVKRRLENK